MDTANTDRAFDDDARKRLWESQLFDAMQTWERQDPAPPPTPDERRQDEALARLIRFARDHGAGLVSEDYLRREALGVMIDIKTSAFIAGVEAGLAAREERA